MPKSKDSTQSSLKGQIPMHASSCNLCKYVRPSGCNPYTNAINSPRLLLVLGLSGLALAVICALWSSPEQNKFVPRLWEILRSQETCLDCGICLTGSPKA